MSRASKRSIRFTLSTSKIWWGKGFMRGGDTNGMSAAAAARGGESLGISVSISPLPPKCMLAGDTHCRHARCCAPAQACRPAGASWAQRGSQRVGPGSRCWSPRCAHSNRQSACRWRSHPPWPAARGEVG
eukprot:70853-Chlamydomonas_euryale.AAC.10